MITLIFITSTLRQSGPTIQLFNIIKHLNPSEYKVHILTLSPEPNNTYWKYFEQLGINLHSLNFSRIKGFFLAKKYLRKLIAEIQPDLIHTQGIRADSLISSIKEVKPIWLLTAHNYPLHDFPMKFGRIRGILMAQRHIKVMQSCPNVVACSQTIATQLAKHSIKAQAIANGAEINFGKSNNDISVNLKHLEKPIFISVGSLIKRKNMKMVIDAFNDYAKNNKGSLIILGDGSQKENLKRMSSERVQLLGNVSNVADYLKIADYFISASLSEGLPNTVLEALTSGIPVLLSDIPSHLEIAEKCPNCCHIFPLANDSNVLAKFMNNISSIFLNQTEDDIKFVARKFFSAQVMSEQYQNKYRSLLTEIEN